MVATSRAATKKKFYNDHKSSTQNNGLTNSECQPYWVWEIDQHIPINKKSKLTENRVQVYVLGKWMHIYYDINM